MQALKEEIPGSAEHRRCDEYFVWFGKRADEAAAGGGAELAAAFRLLGLATSLKLNPNDSRYPFESYFVNQSVRSAILDDISADEIDVLSEVAPEASDAELRARLADIVWVRERNHLLARIAVPAYVESARSILASSLGGWAIARFERALQISAELGKRELLFEQALNAVDDIVSNPDQPGYAVAACLDLLLRYGKNDAARLAKLAENRALSPEATGRPLWQRRFWEYAATFYRRASLPDDANRSQVEVAKTFEDEAKQALIGGSSPGLLTAADFYEKSIQALRRVPGTAGHRDRIHALLLDAQRRAMERWPKTSVGTVDLTEAARRAVDSVQGKPFDEAIRILAMSGQIPNVIQLRAEAERDIEQHPLTFLFPETTLSSSGKVVAKSAAMSDRSREDRESVIRRQMYYHFLRVSNPLYVVGVIEPIRQEILKENYLRYNDWWPLIQYNLFVPAGREPFYVRGLHAGMCGDFVEALHILIPQFENSLRSVLSERGVIVSSLDNSGVQMEFDLNVLLYDSNAEKMFGQDIIFALRGLLVEQAGANLRNQMAHGMLEYGAYFGESAVYLWWLLLRLLLVGAANERDDAGH